MALDVAGPFDEAFSPGYGEDVDFSQRCVQVGLAHVCADEAEAHRGGASFGRNAETTALRDRHEELIAARYPYYHAWVAATADQDVSPLARCSRSHAGRCSVSRLPSTRLRPGSISSAPSVSPSRSHGFLPGTPA